MTSSAYQQIATDIEECSRVHGAGWWQTLGRILIALAWPAFAVGWVLIFFGIMRELREIVDGIQHRKRQRSRSW